MFLKPNQVLAAKTTTMCMINEMDNNRLSCYYHNACKSVICRGNLPIFFAFDE